MTSIFHLEKERQRRSSVQQEAEVDHPEVAIARLHAAIGRNPLNGNEIKASSEEISRI